MNRNRMNRGNLIRGAFAPQESDREPAPDDRAVLLGAQQVTAGVAANNQPIASRAERVIGQVIAACSVLTPKERAELALGFFLATFEARGLDESAIVLEVRKAFAARAGQQ